MRIFWILIFTISFCSASFAQSSDFELTYGDLSLFPTPIINGGGAREKEYVIVKIKNDSLWYTYRQKTSKYREIEKYGKNDEERDTIWLYDTVSKYTRFSYSAVDSIVATLKYIDPSDYLNDSTVDVTSSIMIMDGGETIINLKYNKTEKLNYTIANTFDSVAFRIVNIINSYLPVEHKINIPYRQWNDDIKQQRRLDSLYRKSH